MTTTTARTLGPRQTRAARTDAQQIQFWAMDLAAAINAGNVDLAAQLVAAIEGRTADIAAVIARAK